MTDRYENIRRALADMDAASEARHALAWQDAHARFAVHVTPGTIQALLAERDALQAENEAMKRCAIRYLEWLGVTHMPLDQALYDDMRNPGMCGDAALSGKGGE